MPIPKSKPVEEDAISVDDVKNEAKGIIDKIIKDVGKTSSTQQIAIGTASGWCTGYLAMKVGKVAAVAAGGGILLLQFAAHKGYININWDKVCRQVDKASDRIEKEATGKGPGFLEKVKGYAAQNSYLAAGFAGGFLIGVATSQYVCCMHSTSPIDGLQQYVVEAQMERLVDRKLDKAEDAVRNNKRRARRWWNSVVKEDGSFEITKSHIFHAGFFLGLAVSMMIHR